MPIYEYACESCEHITDALRQIRDADAAITCEGCGKTRTRRIHSVFAAGGGSGESHPLPMGGCGRCGDPNGSCGM